MIYREAVVLLVVLCVVVVPTAEGQNHGETFVTPAFPQKSAAGILFTDSNAGTLYIVRGGEAVPLFSAPGAGRYVSLSPDRTRAGLKFIGRGGEQAPAVLDIGSGELRLLHEPVARAGQVSFADDGMAAYTIGDSLIVTNGVNETRYGLGSYANLAPVSPDARRAAYNDADDQLWLLDLETGSRQRITAGPSGWFRPSWSPDSRRLLFSGLDAGLYVYDTETERTSSLGSGRSASWSSDSRSVVFHRTVTEGSLVTDSDIYLASADGLRVDRLTDSPGVLEMDPVQTPGDGSVLYHTWNRLTIEELPLLRNGTGAVIQAGVTVHASLPSGGDWPQPVVPRSDVFTRLDVPYLHQVYDTPDWFNGHWACAPTQAMMVLAFYGVLPPWPLRCSWPSPGHVTPWGAYVAERYRFREVDYVSAAGDPNGTAAWGGYGYMWTGSYSPRSRMADFYRRHGFTATQTEGTPHSVALAEITAGRPFSMCVLLTQSGHLVLAHGIGAESHTLIFNDPYGDKNRGYHNYAGKDVRYDWPGYNNGYQNLNLVAWCIATDYPPPSPADTLVDDLEFFSGFLLATSAPASMELWKDFNRGYGGHFWWTTTRGPADGPDTCYATWTPTLGAGGLYEVEAYIPFSNATSARYRLLHAGGEDTVIVNQSLAVDSWVSLGTYRFDAGGPATVFLGDASSERGQEIVFDAVRWRYAGGVTAAAPGAVAVPDRFVLYQNYPNPFNSRTQIRFDVPVSCTVTLEVTDPLGRQVAPPLTRDVPAGQGELWWDAAAVASGVYLARLKATDRSGGLMGVAVRKMLLVR